MVMQTNDLIKNAINRAQVVRASMGTISSAANLRWSQIYSAILASRSARDPVNLLLAAANDPSQSLGDIENEFSKQMRKAFTLLEIQTIFTTSTTQTEAFNDSAFVLFDANNTLERLLQDPNDVNSDRIVMEKVFSGADISPIIANANNILTTLVDFA